MYVVPRGILGGKKIWVRQVAIILFKSVFEIATIKNGVAISMYVL